MEDLRELLNFITDNKYAGGSNLETAVCRINRIGMDKMSKQLAWMYTLKQKEAVIGTNNYTFRFSIAKKPYPNGSSYESQLVLIDMQKSLILPEYIQDLVISNKLIYKFTTTLKNTDIVLDTSRVEQQIFDTTNRNYDYGINDVLYDALTSGCKNIILNKKAIANTLDYILYVLDDEKIRISVYSQINIVFWLLDCYNKLNNSFEKDIEKLSNVYNKSESMMKNIKSSEWNFVTAAEYMEYKEIIEHETPLLMDKIIKLENIDEIR